MSKASKPTVNAALAKWAGRSLAVAVSALVLVAVAYTIGTRPGSGSAPSATLEKKIKQTFHFSPMPSARRADQELVALDQSAVPDTSVVPDTNTPAHTATIEEMKKDFEDAEEEFYAAKTELDKLEADLKDVKSAATEGKITVHTLGTAAVAAYDQLFDEQIKNAGQAGGEENAEQAGAAAAAYASFDTAVKAENKHVETLTALPAEITQAEHDVTAAKNNAHAKKLLIENFILYKIAEHNTLIDGLNNHGNAVASSYAAIEAAYQELDIEQE